MKKTIIGSVIVCLLGLTVYGLSNFEKSEEPVKVVQGHLNGVADFSNDKILVGSSNNVFIGDVVRVKGNKSLDGSPETQFTVKVIENLKGNLEGEVTVNQFGGYDKDESGNKVLLLYNNDELLEEGEKYLFATRHLESEDWHTVINTYGTVKIDDSHEMYSLVKRMTSALKAPIVPEAFSEKSNYNNKENLNKSTVE